MNPLHRRLLLAVGATLASAPFARKPRAAAPLDLGRMHEVAGTPLPDIR